MTKVAYYEMSGRSACVKRVIRRVMQLSQSKGTTRIHVKVNGEKITNASDKYRADGSWQYGIG